MSQAGSPQTPSIPSRPNKTVGEEKKYGKDGQDKREKRYRESMEKNIKEKDTFGRRTGDTQENVIYIFQYPLSIINILSLFSFFVCIRLVVIS